MGTYFLQTDRLSFRPWTQKDLELAIGLWGDFEVTKWFDSRGKLTDEQVKARLTQEISTLDSYGVQYWPVFLRKTGNHVGCCGLRPYELSQKIYEIGFHIRSDYWGKGFATEAARGVMKYAFDELKANSLFAGHNPKNEASRHMLRKLGFRYSHDEFYEPTGLSHPSYLLAKEAYRRMGSG